MEKRRTASYVTCETGSRECSAGTWQECLTAGHTTTQSISDPIGTKYVQGLGSHASCAAENLCDPFCTKIEDDSNALPLEAGDDVIVTPGGLTLVQNILPTPIACTALAITPSATTLTVTQLAPVSPNQVQLTASVTPSGCYPGTPPVLWAIDRFDIAAVDNGLVTLVSPIAGPITVTAYAGALAATATLDVRVNVVDTSGAPVGSAAAYPLTTGTADTLQILYPYADTVFPLGLLPPLLQWRTGSLGAASSVKVSLRYPATGTTIFSWSKIVPENATLSLNPPMNTITLPAGPRATLSTAAWDAFEQTARGSIAVFTVQRVVAATLRAEVATSIKFATGQLKGTVYYQSYGTNLVQNYSSTLGAQTIGQGARFGAATLAIRPGNTYPSVAAGYTSASDGPGCRVCHSASANGTTLVSNIFTAVTSDSSLFRLGVDPANGGTPFATASNGRYAWPALYPNGTFLFSNSGPPVNYGSAAPPGALDGGDNGAFVNALYSTASASFGAVIPSTGIPAGLHAALPVFSPDGKKVAFNHYSGTVSAVVGDKRSLGMMDFNVATKAFSGFRRLVTEPTTACSASFGTTDPCTNVWPSFLPSGGGVVYESEIFNNGRVVGKNHADFGGTRSGCDGTGLCGDNGTRAELWWVTSAATPVKARLDQANGLTSGGAVYLPVQTHTGDLDGVCENGETCAEYNRVAGGNDDWACEPGETCLEYQINGNRNGICEGVERCAEWNAAAGGDDDGVCETGETCQERNIAAGGNDNSLCETGETCQEAVGDADYLCETGEVCAEDQASHTTTNEPVLNYEPNVNPEAVGGYNWAVFTSRRLFGNVATMNPWWSDPRFKPIGGQFGPTTKKIWVSALDENPVSGADPSHPAFYLPGQEYLSGNSKAYWVLDACKVASATRSAANECDTSLDCCGAPTTAACSLQTPIANPAVRHCVPLGAAGCIADGAAKACSSHAECCGFATGSRCANGACAAPPPLLVYGPGTYVRDFQAECRAGAKPIWQVFQWQALVPTGTSIKFTAASALTVAELSAAPVVDAGLATTSTTGTWANNPINLNQNLTAIDAGSKEYLRVTIVLTPTPNSMTAPTLQKWRVIYDCFDAE